MREPPEGAALLMTAREVVLKELLPHLPEAQKFAARMVANAIAIAAREAVQEDWQQGAAADIARLIGDGGDDPMRRFAAAIRAGHCDPGTALHDEAFRVLRETARRRAEVSNPRVLG